MEHTLMDLMYKTPSDDTIRKCIVTKEAVEGTGEPEIIHGEAKLLQKSRTQNIPFEKERQAGNSLMKGMT